MCSPSTLMVIGLLLLLLGALDPLEGAVGVFVGAGLVALGAYLSHSEHRTLLARAFVLVSIGVTGMLAQGALRAAGWVSGGSWWWGLFLLPYVAGGVMALGGVVLWFSDRLDETHTGGGDLAPR